MRRDKDPHGIKALRSGPSGQEQSGKASWQRWLLGSVMWEMHFWEDESEEKGSMHCKITCCLGQL